MERLGDTLAWAATADLKPLQAAVRSAGLSVLRAIGSGGSLTAAHAVASAHEQFAGRMAAVVTPLEASQYQTDSAVSQWLVSAGGGNVDIMAAAKSLIACEPRQLAVLCGREDSPLADLCRAHPFVDLLVYPPPTGKDGFLATNSLFGFAALLARAYAHVFEREASWEAAHSSLAAILAPGSGVIGAWRATTEPLWARPTTLVLHGPATRVGAVDLESKFTEAALGNVQVADYRNFAHGRHHWLAKRAEVSGVLALITEEDVKLAERTLDLIPSDIPQARLALEGDRTSTSLTSLLAALRITEWAGAARGIDPGRPGVPEFGRKLYNLPLPVVKPARVAGLTPRDTAAIWRKSGVSVPVLESRGELQRWRAALAAFRDHLWSTRFQGVVLDYDGTVVETRERFEHPRAAMTDALVRLMTGGAWLGIATGRGKSVRQDLRAVLPQTLWDRVLIGYYNGADVALLDDDSAPDGSDGVCDALANLARALREDPELSDGARQTDRRQQITLEARRVMPEGRLWDLAQQVIMLGDHDVSVTRSSHSIDIVPTKVSKLSVIAKLRSLGQGQMLSIGDRGRWPGNDYALLREPWSLGVDEISVDPKTCWNLGRPGQRGTAVTLEYLSALVASPDGLLLAPGALK
jgi:trehalose-6-phosphatase